MSNPLDTLPAKRLAALLTFIWGDSGLARYAAWTDDLTLDGDTFTAEPRVKIEPGKLHGGAEDIGWRLTLPETCEPIARAAVGVCAPIVLLIEEVDPEDATTRREVYRGEIVKLTRNAGGRGGVVRVELAGIKASLQIAMGVSCGVHCAWMFGDEGGSPCGKELAPLREIATVSAIDGSQLTLTGLSTTTANYWLYGYVEREGLRIAVRKHPSGSELTLDVAPPDDWLGELVTLTPGCAKTIAACRAWSNEANFGGFGYAMPAYHPMIESP